MLNKIFTTLSTTLMLLAFTTNTLKADMIFYYSAAVLPSIVGQKDKEPDIKPMVSFKDNAHGYEPWIVDIENNKAHMVKDIHTDGADTVVRDMFVTIEGITYFFADDGINGFGLWKTDGSEEGTVLVKNYHNTMERALHMFELKGKVYFQANTEEYGYQIWTSDGTSEGTVCITKDILNNAYSGGLVVIDDTMYFKGNGPAVYGNQLWKSDGTAEGTVPITNIPGYGPDNLVNVNGVLYFRFFTENKTNHLYRTDGTMEGLEVFPETSIGTGIPLIPFKGKLLLFNFNQNSLKVFDGKAFTLIKNFSQNSFSSSNLTNITITENAVYFVTYDSTSTKILFKTDGTSEGTLIIEGLPLEENPNGYYPQALAYMDNKLYFSYHNGSNDIWCVEDGNTTAKKVVDITSGTIEYMKAVNHLLYIKSGKRWMVSDGTQDGTTELKVFSKYASSSRSWVYPYNATLAKINQCGNKVCTLQDDGEHGFELWKTDGTVAGTELLKDINTATKNSVFAKYDFQSNQRLEYNYAALTTPSQEYAKINNRYIFKGRDGSLPQIYEEFFVSDGTKEGTEKVSLDTGTLYAQQTYPSVPFILNNDYSYFPCREGDYRSLCKSDGTVTGTEVLKHLFYGNTGSIKSMAIYKGTLYFNAKSELWKSDGTKEGTILVEEIKGEGSKDYVKYIFNSNDEKMYIMMAYDTLWVSEGNSSSTIKIFDDPELRDSKMFILNGETYFLRTYTGGAYIDKVNNNQLMTMLSLSGSASFTVVGNTLYINRNFSRELWISNATQEGTVLLKDGFLYGSIDQLIDVNNKLFFVAGDEAHGEELWMSDGTTAGTVMIKDITVGPLSSGIKILNVKQGKLLFTVKNEEGLKLWISDGTEAGTKVMDTSNH